AALGEKLAGTVADRRALSGIWIASQRLLRGGERGRIASIVELNRRHPQPWLGIARSLLGGAAKTGDRFAWTVDRRQWASGGIEGLDRIGMGVARVRRPAQRGHRVAGGDQLVAAYERVVGGDRLPDRPAADDRDRGDPQTGGQTGDRWPPVCDRGGLG